MATNKKGKVEEVPTPVKDTKPVNTNPIVLKDDGSTYQAPMTQSLTPAQQKYAAYGTDWTEKGTGNTVKYGTEAERNNAWNATQYANLQGGADALKDAKTDANGNTYYEVTTNKGTKQYATYDNAGNLHVVNAKRGVESLANVNAHYNNNPNAIYSLGGVDYAVSGDKIEEGMDRNDVYNGYSSRMNDADDRYRTDMRSGTDIAEEQAKRDYDNAANDLYKLYRTNQNKLDETLSARGVTGGTSETANLGLMNNYASNLSASEQNRLKVNAQLEQDYYNKVASNSMNVANQIADAYLNLAREQVSRDEYVADRDNERAYNKTMLDDERRYNEQRYDYERNAELTDQKDYARFTAELTKEANAEERDYIQKTQTDAVNKAVKNTKGGKYGYLVYDPAGGYWTYSSSKSYAQACTDNGGMAIQYHDGKAKGGLRSFDQTMDLAKLSGSKGGSGGTGGGGTGSQRRTGNPSGGGQDLNVDDLKLDDTPKKEEPTASGTTPLSYDSKERKSAEYTSAQRTLNSMLQTYRGGGYKDKNGKPISANAMIDKIASYIGGTGLSNQAQYTLLMDYTTGLNK